MTMQTVRAAQNLETGAWGQEKVMQRYLCNSGFEFTQDPLFFFLSNAVRYANSQFILNTQRCTHPTQKHFGSAWRDTCSNISSCFFRPQKRSRSQWRTRYRFEWNAACIHAVSLRFCCPCLLCSVHNGHDDIDGMQRPSFTSVLNFSFPIIMHDWIDHTIEIELSHLVRDETGTFLIPFRIL